LINPHPWSPLRYRPGEISAYKVWNQFYLDSETFVAHYLLRLKEIYNLDEQFKKYLKEDFESMNNTELKLDDTQIDFFLEEHLMLYFITKGKMKLENNFINGHEKWILVAYPGGKPLKAHIYLHQKNFFDFDNPGNPYQDSWYDLKEKKLYDFKKIDLNTF